MGLFLTPPSSFKHSSRSAVTSQAFTVCVQRVDATGRGGRRPGRRDVEGVEGLLDGGEGAAAVDASRSRCRRSLLMRLLTAHVG